MLSRYSKITLLLDVILLPVWLRFRFQNAPKSRLRGVLGRLEGGLGVSWGCLGDVLERFGGVLERLGRFLGHLGARFLINLYLILFSKIDP